MGSEYNDLEREKDKGILGVGIFRMIIFILESSWFNI